MFGNSENPVRARAVAGPSKPGLGQPTPKRVVRALGVKDPNAKPAVSLHFRTPEPSKQRKQRVLSPHVEMEVLVEEPVLPAEESDMEVETAGDSARDYVEPFPVFSEALDLSTGEYRAMLHTVNLSTTTYEEQEAEDELLRSSFVAVLPAFDARSHRALLESDDEDGENRAFPLPKRLVRVAKSTNVPSSTIKKSSNALLGGRKPAVTTGGTPKPKWGSSLPVSTGPATRREPPMSLARAPRQPLVALALPLPASLPRLPSRPVAAVSRPALLKPSSKLSSIQISTTLVGSSSEESLLGVFGIVDSEGFDDLDFAALDLDDDARSEFTFGDEGAEGF